MSEFTSSVAIFKGVYMLKKKKCLQQWSIFSLYPVKPLPSIWCFDHIFILQIIFLASLMFLWLPWVFIVDLWFFIATLRPFWLGFAALCLVGSEPMSSALEGGFLTTGPPGKSPEVLFYFGFFHISYHKSMAFSSSNLLSIYHKKRWPSRFCHWLSFFLLFPFFYLKNLIKLHVFNTYGFLH